MTVKTSREDTDWDVLVAVCAKIARKLGDEQARKRWEQSDAKEEKEEDGTAKTW